MYLLSGVLREVLCFCLLFCDSVSSCCCHGTSASKWHAVTEYIYKNTTLATEREKRERENILFKKINFHFSSEICQIITNTGICTIFHSVPLMVPGAKCLLIRYFKTCFKISTALGDYFYKPELHVSRGSQNIHIKFGGGGGELNNYFKKLVRYI